MPTYDIPGPLHVVVETAVADLVLDTHDEPTATVEVRALADDDVTREAVEGTRVELVARGDRHELLVVTPKRSGIFFGREPRMRIEARVPEGATLLFKTASGDVTANGRLGDVRGKTASGDVTVGAAANVRVDTASGDVRVTEVSGDADARSASGEVTIGRVGGRLDAHVVSGDLRVDSVGAGGSAGTVSGDVTLTAVESGALAVRSVSGDVVVGIVPGARVHVDVTTVSGDLRSDVALDDAPASGTADGPVVDISGRTVSGDVHVRRAAAAR